MTSLLRKITFVIAVLLAPTAAQSQVEAISLPPELPPLPSPNDPNSTLYLTRANASLFHELLLAPVASWLKDGKFVIRLASRLAFDWKLTADWIHGTTVNSSNMTLDEQRSLVPRASFVPSIGFPFGTAQEINQSSDLVEKAYKVLWNAAYAESPSLDVLYDFELAWLGEQSLIRKAGGIFYRRTHAEPYALPPVAKETTEKETDEAKAKTEEQPPQALTFSSLDDLFQQDLLQLLYPPVVLGFAQLTHRYRGIREDNVWSYSPVIGKGRQILGSNRGDPLLDGALSVNDLFVSSSKIQELNAKVVAEKVLLVAYPSLRQVELVEKRFYRVGGEGAEATGRPASGEMEKIFTSGELFERRDAEVVSMLWNHETRRYPQATAWVPTEAYLVPRRVWIIELTPRDPFSVVGRQVLVVDQESMLPVYKIVYDRRGRYQRTIVGGWALTSTDRGEHRFPFLAFLLAVDEQAVTAMSITTKYVQTFFGKETPRSKELHALFDIENHGETEEEEQS